MMGVCVNAVIDARMSVKRNVWRPHERAYHPTVGVFSHCPVCTTLSLKETWTEWTEDQTCSIQSLQKPTWDPSRSAWLMYKKESNLLHNSAVGYYSSGQSSCLATREDSRKLLLLAKQIVPCSPFTKPDFCVIQHHGLWQGSVIVKKVIYEEILNLLLQCL